MSQILYPVRRFIEVVVLVGSFQLSLSGTVAGAPSDSVVVFNELMYHPGSADGVGESEWVELYNQMGVDIDMSGWRLSGGVEFTFPEGTVIGGGDYLLVSSNQFEGFWTTAESGSA